MATNTTTTTTTTTTIATNTTTTTTIATKYYYHYYYYYYYYPNNYYYFYYYQKSVSNPLIPTPTGSQQARSSVQVNQKELLFLVFSHFAQGASKLKSHM